MIVRIVAAAVALSVFLPSLYVFGVGALELFVPLAVVGCLWEFATMAFTPESARVRWGAMTIAACCVYLPTVYGGADQALAVSGPVLVGLFVVACLLPGHAIGAATDQLARMLLGVLWSLMLVFAVLIARWETGMAWLFVAFVSTWLGDTGAYFAGKAFGKRRLYPALSPNKTWEGVAGGLTLSTIGVVAMALWVVPALSIGEACLLAPVLYAAGVFGDLTESMVKRSFGVKDSGGLMPGHGGLLDRLDSFMAVGPMLFLWMTWMEG